MSQLVAQTKVRGLLSCYEDGDWPALFSLLNQCDDKVRTALAVAVTKEHIGSDAGRAKALEYLSECGNPAVAVRAALIALTVMR